MPCCLSSVYYSSISGYNMRSLQTGSHCNIAELRWMLFSRACFKKACYFQGHCICSHAHRTAQSSYVMDARRLRSEKCSPDPITHSVSRLIKAFVALRVLSMLEKQLAHVKSHSAISHPIKFSPVV